MIKCIFCGHPEIKQPAVSTAIVTNITPMCEYHYKMFKDWATDEEREEGMINTAEEWTEIRKHVILYMIGKKEEGLTDEQITGDTKYMLNRLLHGVDSGAALNQMEKTIKSLKTIDDSIRRVQRNER